MWLTSEHKPNYTDAKVIVFFYIIEYNILNGNGDQVLLTN